MRDPSRRMQVQCSPPMSRKDLLLRKTPTLLCWSHTGLLDFRELVQPVEGSPDELESFTAWKSTTLKVSTRDAYSSSVARPSGLRHLFRPKSYVLRVASVLDFKKPSFTGNLQKSLSRMHAKKSACSAGISRPSEPKRTSDLNSTKFPPSFHHVPSPPQVTNQTNYRALSPPPLQIAQIMRRYRLRFLRNATAETTRLLLPLALAARALRDGLV